MKIYDNSVVCSIVSEGNLHSPDRVSNMFVQCFYSCFPYLGAGEQIPYGGNSHSEYPHGVFTICS